MMSPKNSALSYSGAITDVNGYFAVKVMATYSCDTGFALINSDSRTYTGNRMSVNGGFNGAAPTCDCECSSY